MYKLALTELWNNKDYGNSPGEFQPNGHYISPFEALEFQTNNIDELNNLSVLKPELELNLVKLYNVADYTLCIICTPYIKILQRNWRKKYNLTKAKITKYRNIKSLYNRELYGR